MTEPLLLKDRFDTWLYRDREQVRLPRTKQTGLCQSITTPHFRSCIDVAAFRSRTSRLTRPASATYANRLVVPPPFLKCIHQRHDAMAWHASRRCSWHANVPPQHCHLWEMKDIKSAFLTSLLPPAIRCQSWSQTGRLNLHVVKAVRSEVLLSSGCPRRPPRFDVEDVWEDVCVIWSSQC